MWDKDKRVLVVMAVDIKELEHCSMGHQHGSVNFSVNTFPLLVNVESKALLKPNTCQSDIRRKRAHVHVHVACGTKTKEWW